MAHYKTIMSARVGLILNKSHQTKIKGKEVRECLI